MTAADTLERWRSEKTAAFLSSAVAAAEPDQAKASLFKDMAAATEEQAGILAQDLGARRSSRRHSAHASSPKASLPSARAPCAPSCRPPRCAASQSIAARQRLPLVILGLRPSKRSAAAIATSQKT